MDKLLHRRARPPQTLHQIKAGQQPAFSAAASAHHVLHSPDAQLLGNALVLQALLA